MHCCICLVSQPRGHEPDMQRATADLREIIEAVEFHADGRVSIAGDSFEVPAADGAAAMTSLLASTLYRRLYCRPSQRHTMPGGDRRAARVFVGRLSQAN